MKTDLYSEFEIFPWNKNLDTGHTVIDEQHRTLVELLNRLARTLIDAEHSVINDAFDELAAYANWHFEDEEAIWRTYFKDNSWYSSHQLRHASFLPKVIELKEGDSGKPLADVIEQVIKFLIRWLAFHIIDDDKRMAFAVEAMASGVPIDEAKAIADNKMGGSMRILIETVLNMYDGLSSRTLDLLRERKARMKAEEELKEVNRKLEALSLTDQLTELFNRRHLYAIFDNESRRARRGKMQLAYYLIDIDYFKRFNDSYGHLCGDTALRQVANCLQDICRRPSDAAFRVGGEEFSILSVHYSAEDAMVFGERVRQSIEDLKIPHQCSDISEFITVSVGGACKVPSGEDTFDHFMAEADQRLYRAKSSGRNRVVMSG
ncbi:MAG TPA: GGDEF domain-containing protein [Gammaproteobacteria bacterium]|nr:GGDEF domain-containing protein [Gammaproteobacteria bacterium]HRF45576.1 diguanylate cyclase [Candidatus Competibacteraceae bacterium]